MEKKIVGVFQSPEQAIRVINSLKEQGYRTEDISFLTKKADDQYDIEMMTETKHESDKKIETGIATGATTGGVLGGITGLLMAVGAFAIPGVGPIIAAGPIAATLGGAAIGAGTGGLAGALIGAGVPEEHAEEYERYLNLGHILVMVDSEPERDRGVYETFRSNDLVNSHMYDFYSQNRKIY